jgi:hypothetical protein
MKQTVTITQHADRHAEAHDRAFAEVSEMVVQASGLAGVLSQVAERTTLPTGRYSLHVSEPYT